MRRAPHLLLVLGAVAVALGTVVPAAAQTAEPSGRIAVVNGRSPSPVAATVDDTVVVEALDYAADAEAAIVPAGPHTVTFGDGASVALTVVVGSAQTVVSGFGDDDGTAKAYPVEVAPIDPGKAKVQVWNATDRPVEARVEDISIELQPGAPAIDRPLAIDGGTTYTITVGDVSRTVTFPADSYTDLFIVSDGETLAIARAVISSMTELVDALRPPDEVTVPDVAGKPADDARTVLETLGLVVATDERPSDAVPAGSVIGTEPAAGASVAPGTEVTMTVSSGPETPPTVAVPEVAGKPAAEARAALEAAGLAVTTREEASETVAAGAAIGTEPPAGSEVPAGSSVTLLVSTGPAEVEVPDLIGMTRDDAAATIEAVGLAATFLEDPDRPDPDGVVVSQVPAAGETAAPGAEVTARLSPKLEEPWAILQVDRRRVLTVTGLHFLPNGTVTATIVENAFATDTIVRDDGVWVMRLNVAVLDPGEYHLRVVGTGEDESVYDHTFTIPATGESTSTPDSSPGPAVPAWAWIALVVVVGVIIWLVVRIFGGSPAETADPGSGGDGG